MQKNVFCFIRMLFCLIALNCLLIAQSVAENKKPASAQKGVDVFDAKGKSLGRLEENKNGSELLLTSPGKKTVPIGGFSDDIKQKWSVPGSNLIAAVYVRNCGATTDFATRLDIVSNINDIGKNDSNTVFIMKGNQPVKVQWLDINTITVNYPYWEYLEGEYIYKQLTAYGNLIIKYHQTDDVGAKTNYLEYSNFNYGVTGINVTGLSEDILLRVAGWSQEKSGLTRKEWGYWYGQPPYGDDPNEQNYIKQGFIFSKQNKGK